MLERLILLRHAKAVREHEAPSDFERGLTERGLNDAAAAGAAIAAVGWDVDVALASPAARTLQTLRTVAPVLAAFKRGRRTVTRERARLHAP